MKDWKKSILFSCLVLASISAYSQNKLKGVVLDQDFSQGLVGSTILVKGTQHGISANLDGDFEFDVPQQEGEIIVSFIGYQTKSFLFKVGVDKVFDFGNIF
ncbi:MAG: carboxypeptidase-like regulatory domain-containing protein, partial [Flavobacterium sp.]